MINQASICDKNTQQRGNKGIIPQHNKYHVQKPYCQHCTLWAKTKSTCLKIRNMTGVSAFTSIIQHSTESPSHIDETKEIKGF